jgi:hypothetical protein
MVWGIIVMKETLIIAERGVGVVDPYWIAGFYADNFLIVEGLPAKHPSRSSPEKCEGGDPAGIWSQVSQYLPEILISRSTIFNLKSAIHNPLIPDHLIALIFTLVKTEHLYYNNRCNEKYTLTLSFKGAIIALFLLQLL